MADQGKLLPGEALWLISGSRAAAAGRAWAGHCSSRAHEAAAAQDSCKKECVCTFWALPSSSLADSFTFRFILEAEYDPGEREVQFSGCF